jgi:beta-lactamase superfamily II metal-dependent hydrolase
MRLRLTGLLIASLLATCGAGRADEPKPGLDIFFNDVMGGAATLIVTPERESILIDCGWPGFNDRDPRRIVHALKDLAGCDHLDHLVITHWHVDHFGGVEGLAKLVRIDHFWDRGLPEDGSSEDFPDGPKADDPLGIAYRKASQGKRTALGRGERIPLKGETSLVVLASGGQVVQPADPGIRPEQAAVNPLCAEAPPDQKVDPSDNARSLAMKLSMRRFDFFDAGDLTWNIEKKLVCPVNLIGAVDLYQVTHHGLDISNNPVLVRSVEPTVAIMNNGPRKGGSARAVKLIKSIPSVEAFYALHKNQQTGPEDNAEPALTANSDPAGGQLIHVHVEPDGSRFTVKVGENGEPRSFTSR